jgi:drug/metabolite transporter (DMT)-like permease
MTAGYGLLGLQPLPVAWLASAGFATAATVFSRFLFSALIISLICVVRRRWLKTGNPRVLLLRGLFGGTAVLLYFYSIGHAGAARGTLLNYTYPFWANLMAWSFGKRPPRAFWPILGLATAGVWCLLYPEEGWGAQGIGLGELAGLGSAICAGAAVLAIKKLRETDESLTIVMAFSICGMLIALPLVPLTDALNRLHTTDVATAALLVGVLSFVGHVLFTRGYRGVTLASGTLLSLLVPLVASAGGILYLSEPASPRFFLGAGMIFSALVLSVLSNARRRPSVEPRLPR